MITTLQYLDALSDLADLATSKEARSIVLLRQDELPAAYRAPLRQVRDGDITGDEAEQILSDAEAATVQGGVTPEAIQEALKTEWRQPAGKVLEIAF